MIFCLFVKKMEFANVFYSKNPIHNNNHEYRRRRLFYKKKEKEKKKKTNLSLHAYFQRPTSQTYHKAYSPAHTFHQVVIL